MKSMPEEIHSTVNDAFKVIEELSKFLHPAGINHVRVLNSLFNRFRYLADEYYRMDDIDRSLIARVRRAVDYDAEGNPVKDVMDEDDMVDAMRLLLQIIDEGCAA